MLYERVDRDYKFEIERLSRKLRDHVTRQPSPSSIWSPSIFPVQVARRVTREHENIPGPMNRSRTSFCPRSDNRSREQERRKQELVLQLVQRLITRELTTRFYVGSSSKKKNRKSRTCGTPSMRNRIRSQCAHSTRTLKSSPLRRVGPVFRRDETRSTCTRHVEDNANRQHDTPRRT